VKKLIIGASKNTLIGSKAIQWWIDAPYSHVYARWDLSSQDRSILYQASHGMVHFIEFTNFKKDNEIVKEIQIELTDEQFQKFSRKCIDLAGQKYSKLQLLQIFLCDLSNGNIKVEDQKGYICSELMGELLEDLGYTLPKPKYLLTPKDIIQTLEAKNGTT